MEILAPLTAAELVVMMALQLSYNLRTALELVAMDVRIYLESQIDRLLDI